MQTAKKSLIHEHRSLLLLLLVLSLAYFPFVNKAFTVDDTLFLNAAEQIMLSPLDFFGGQVNWYGFADVHHAINKNPPLVPYLMAGVVSVFGYSEIALHSFFFLALVLSAVGIYLLGHQFNTNPLLTTLLAVFTPVFLVHGSTVMTDSTMLMFWIWALVFWMAGIRSGVSKWFFLSGLSVALGVLTKYSCVFLIPLIVFSGIWQYRKPGMWMFAFLIPLGALGLYELYTNYLYGQGLFSSAFLYAQEHAPRSLLDYFDNTLIALAYLGGCFPVALLFMPLKGGRWLRVLLSVSAAVLAILVYSRGNIGDHAFIRDGSFAHGLIFQFCAFTLAGIYLFTTCLKELYKKVSHDSVFLFLWFSGIFVFACYLNWTINARSFILLVPVVGILLSRSLEDWGINKFNFRRNVSYAMIGFAGLIAVATVHADFLWAGTARTAAHEIMSKYGKQGQVWFQGHWGFQFYMEKLGAKPMNFSKQEIQPGDFVAIPVNNTALTYLHDRFVMIEDWNFKHGSYVATMSPNTSAGFYSSIWGPMPYAVEAPATERYLMFRKMNN